MTIHESPSTRLVLQHVLPSATDQVAYFHFESSASVIAGARLASAGDVVATHRRFAVVEQLRRDLAVADPGNVRVAHAHGSVALDSLGERDLVVIRLTPERVAFHLLLLDAALLLRAGGRCVVVGGNNEGIKPAARAMEHVFGAVQVVAHGGGHRLLASVKPETLDPAVLDTLAAPYHDPAVFHEIDLVLRDEPLRVFSRPGVFSWEHLDEATAVLASVMEIPPGADVLDLGCGAGILGAVAGRLSREGTVTLVDTDSESVRSAARTMQASGVAKWRALSSDVTSAVAGETFDVVVTNPPFHVGKSTDLALPVRFMEEAIRVLRPGGRLLLVANRTLPYERELDRIAGARRTVHDGARFKVLEATTR